jgi:uncharacterized membrane protein
MHAAELWLTNFTQCLKLLVEGIGVVVVAAGILVAAYQFVRLVLGRHTDSFNQVRLEMARYLALGLEFQLGADILSTAIAPSWEQIGVIRTLLNFFLMHEMERESSSRETAAASRGRNSGGAAASGTPKYGGSFEDSGS